MTLIDGTQLALQRALEGASLRQEALASNIANVNTPGYQRRDVDFHASLAAAMRAADPGTAVVSAGFTTTQSGGAVRADGGTVDVDAESAKLAANGLEYEQLAAATKTRLEILRAAMGVG